MPPSPPPEVFGWDFFNPFDEVRRVAEPAVVVGGLDRSSYWYLRAEREQEGIPELEEAEEEEEEEVVKETLVEEIKKMAALDVGATQESGGEGIVVEGGAAERREEELGLLATPGQGRELLQALREVEDHFIRAHHSGKEVSRMLECSMVHPQAGHEETKGLARIFESLTQFSKDSVNLHGDHLKHGEDLEQR